MILVYGVLLFGPPDKGGIGPSNSLSSVHPSVRWSTDFSETIPWIFAKFCTKISHDMNLKITERIFRENSGCPPGGQKGGGVKYPQNGQNCQKLHFFTHCGKLVPWIFIKLSKKLLLNDIYIIQLKFTLGKPWGGQK